jgi:hypothetical protein
MSKDVQFTIIKPSRAGEQTAIAYDARAELAKTARAEIWASAIKTVAGFGFFAVLVYSTCNAVC